MEQKHLVKISTVAMRQIDRKKSFFVIFRKTSKIISTLKKYHFVSTAVITLILKFDTNIALLCTLATQQLTHKYLNQC